MLMELPTAARYNAWANRRLYAACAGLTHEERVRDRRGFFRSIHGTLNHILLSDLIYRERLETQAHHLYPPRRDPPRGLRLSPRRPRRPGRVVRRVLRRPRSGRARRDPLLRHGGDRGVLQPAAQALPHQPLPAPDPPPGPDPPHAVPCRRRPASARLHQVQLRRVAGPWLPERARRGASMTPSSSEPGRGDSRSATSLPGPASSTLVLERSSIASSWREHRWDSFCTVTPNWSIRLPGAEYAGDDPDGFLGRDELVRHFEAWARSFGAPVGCGIEARAVRPAAGGFEVATNEGAFRARNVVIATSTYQNPHVPAVSERLPRRLVQLTPHDYKHPGMLPPGAVMVVGSGQTGCQLAEELHEAGREVFLCVGRAGRLPRRWRGRDCIEWQRDMGYLDRTPDLLESPAARFRGDPHLTGRNGGYTLSLHDFHRRGIRLLGRLADCEGERARFDGGLHAEMRFADGFCDRIVAQFERHICRAGDRRPGADRGGARGRPAGGRGASRPRVRGRPRRGERGRGGVGDRLPLRLLVDRGAGPRRRRLSESAGRGEWVPRALLRRAELDDVAQVRDPLRRRRRCAERRRTPPRPARHRVEEPALRPPVAAIPAGAR